MKAYWNGVIVAESNATVIIENNHYFPPSSISAEYFESSDTHTVCPWKGTAHYLTLNVNGNRNIDAAWYYPEVSEMAKDIKGYFAFWKGVEIKE